MLKITVKYFLNTDGINYFPQWYAEVAELTAQQDGFIKIDCDVNQENPIVYLYFEDEDKLNNWAETNLHDYLMKKIEGFCISPEEVDFEVM